MCSHNHHYHYYNHYHSSPIFHSGEGRPLTQNWREGAYNTLFHVLLNLPSQLHALSTTVFLQTVKTGIIPVVLSLHLLYLWHIMILKCVWVYFDIVVVVVEKLLLCRFIGKYRVTWDRKDRDLSCLWEPSVQTFLWSLCGIRGLARAQSCHIWIKGVLNYYNADTTCIGLFCCTCDGCRKGFPP